MSQNLIAVWDYEATGEFELSFKQGDKIKLLEKHNDDWWEGELDGVIGFFPVNRIKLEEDTITHTPDTNNEQDIPPTEETDQSDDRLASPLPSGWEYAYDDDGTIYYFNESTGESSWEMPPEDINKDKPSELESIGFIQGLTPSDLKRLEFDQLQSEWIRFKGYIQMKMISENEDVGKLSSWKSFYAILSNGFLLLYKEGHVKSKKPSRTHVPVGSFDLEACKIDPASKTVTRRKNVFIISTPKKVKIFIQALNEKEFSAWLDAIMRELIARKEQQNGDTEIMRLLKSLVIDDNQMKVNRKMVKDGVDDKRYRGHWFRPKSQKKMQKIEPKFVYGQQPPSDENDIFGGYLRLKEDGDVPDIVTLCINEVDKRGLESVGIYRISGPASVIQKYRTAFNLRKCPSSRWYTY
ncbi:hypothetical protein BDB01DRAFT_769830 [Pilobolus umbonatus]|nr:hypothetical protein BDB01DRAFT_769830 [Pilobolus umbonatus]